MTIQYIQDENISIKDINNIAIGIYNPENQLIVYTNNQLVFEDIRIQIKEKQLTGYYIKFNGEKIKIDRNGNLEKWPDGLFDKLTDLLLKLV